MLLAFSFESCRLSPCRFLTRGLLKQCFLSCVLLMHGLHSRGIRDQFFPRRLLDSGLLGPAGIFWNCRDVRRRLQRYRGNDELGRAGLIQGDHVGKCPRPGCPISERARRGRAS